MKRKKSWLRAVTAGVLALSMLPMTGCQSGGEDSTADSGSGEGAIDVAVIVKSMASTYWNSVWDACNDLEKEFGSEVNIIRLGPNEEKTELQQQEIEKAISQGVDAIVLAACDPEAENDTLQKAADANIKIVTIDSDVNFDGRSCYLGTDNIRAAEAAAQYSADILGGEGKIGIIYHGDATTATDRRETFEDYLSGESSGVEDMPAGAGSKQNNSVTEETDAEGNPVAVETAAEEEVVSYDGIKVVNQLDGQSDWEASKEAAKKLILEDQVDLIFGTNSKGAWGACVAIQELLDEGKISEGQVHVVGFDYFSNDGTDAGDYFANGILDATLVQNPYNMGYMGVRYAMDLVNGQPVTSVVDTGVTVVTPENLDSEDVQFLISH